jgi:hypothetical protein
LVKNGIFRAVQPAMLRKILFPVLAIGAAMVLSSLIDDNLGSGWPSNVVRNWQEFGFFNLHGQLVYNAGGFEAIQHPEAYKGMCPISLYPVFFATEIFGWTGLGTLSFHILLALAVFWASRHLLGGDHFATMVAAAAILCPAYLRWPKILDPNTLAALPVLPYAVLVLTILKKPKLTPTMTVALAVLTLAFMSLNWTTAWVCGPCIVFLLGMPGLNRGGLATVFGVMVIGVPLVVAASFAAKFIHNTGDSASAGFGPGQIIAGYTWGSGGYGEGTSTGRAFLRLAFVNVIGLLPLWLIFIYALVRYARAGTRPLWLALAPLTLTIADVIIMRNYFGHHPWMAGPVLMIGTLFSLALLRPLPTADARETSEKIPFKVVCGVALLCFVYGFAVLTFFRVNEMGLLNLVKLVQQHTARSDTIVLLKSDSQTAPLVDRLIEPLDRHIIIVNGVQDLAAESHWVILSPVKLDASLALVAQSAADSHSWLTDVADWFNHSISKRAPGDRLELPASYYLYAPGR